MTKSSSVPGQHLYPMLYILINIGFNISALSLVRTCGNVISSLVGVVELVQDACLCWLFQLVGLHEPCFLSPPIQAMISIIPFTIFAFTVGSDVLLMAEHAAGSQLGWPCDGTVIVLSIQFIWNNMTTVSLCECSLIGPSCQLDSLWALRSTWASSS